MIKYFLAALLSLTLTSPAFAASKGKGSCEQTTAGETALSKDDSLKSGILMHGEHWVDLILRQAGTADMRPLKVFTETLEQLLSGIHKGQLASVNEKVDGSPSVVFGFDKKGKPFVAYKGHFSKKTQTLVTTPEEAQQHFKRSAVLKNIFTTLFALAQGPLAKSSRKFKNYIFQGDLLFVNKDSRIQISDTAVNIQANSLLYTITNQHPLYNSLRAASAGVVFHTVGQRDFDEDGRVVAKSLDESSEEEALVRQFVEAMQTPEFFVMHPWRDNVALASAGSSIDQEVIGRLKVISSTLESLSPDFRDQWRINFEPKLRTFFNAGLRPPFDGGFYKVAATGESIDVSSWIQQFMAWLRSREEDALAEKFSVFLSTYGREVAAVIEAYAQAVAIQYKIQPLIKPAMVSKLGGGDVEGIMLKTEDSVVKWVDRLEFTMRNNAKWNRGAHQAPVEEINTLPFPLNEWRAGSSFVVMKGQPIHAGHVQMILAAAAQNPGMPVFVLASTKGPNLEAKKWNDLDATDTKKDLRARNYTYIFDRNFREKLLVEGLKDTGVQVAVVNPSMFWSYLRTAKAQGLQGSVKLVVGEKEVEAGRYDLQLQELGDYLELQSVAMTEGGLSATQVRAALKAAAVGTEEEQVDAQKLLLQAFSYLKDAGVRQQAVEEAIAQWKNLDQIAQSLIAPAKKAEPVAKKAKGLADTTEPVAKKKKPQAMKATKKAS